MLAETFPAAQLCHWGVPHDRYDREVHRERRRQLVARLAEQLSLRTSRPVAISWQLALEFWPDAEEDELFHSAASAITPLLGGNGQSGQQIALPQVRRPIFGRR